MIDGEADVPALGRAGAVGVVSARCGAIRKIGVIAYFPFALGTNFQRAGSKPLPDWAAEFDAKTWSQFFLKYVVSNPAVTVVRAGTTQAAHMLENIGGGIGRLPDEATRQRMAALVDSWPGARFK